MKSIRTLLMVLFIGIGSLSIAEDVDIDAQIAKIQAAPADQRVELMNELKESVAAMNEADRMAAIAQLRSKMQASHQDGSSVQEGQLHVQEMQMQTNEQLTHIQNMNQNRVVDQIINNNIPSINEVSPIHPNHNIVNVAINDYLVLK